MRGKWLKTIMKAILIIALFTCIALTNGATRKVTVIESVFNSIITLPQKIYAYTREYVTGNDGYFVDIEKLREENELLKTEIEELREKVIGYEELYAENQVLKNHVNLADKYPDYNVVVADIISDSATNWEKIYIVNRGEKDGVQPGMTVIAEDGLVGYVETVTANTAKIISILDAGNSVSGRITRTRDEVVCKGSISLIEEQSIKVMNIPVGATLIEGDKIETSGIGGIYPKGIGIGKVTEVLNKKNPIENEAIIETYVDFDKIETIAIIVDEMRRRK